MYAVRYHEAGGPDVLQYEQIDDPAPAADEVLVEIRAASVNPVDAKRRAAVTPPSPKTTGSDLAGVVVDTGDRVTEYEPGDRVFATGLHTERFTGGSFAELAAVPTDLLAHLPDTVSFEEGAAVALVGVTAWRAFVDHATLHPGDTVFIHGGNGGVGHIAIGLAATMGATVIATARPQYHDSLRDLGATHLLDYHRDDLLDATRDLATGVDVVLDHLPETYLDFNIDIASLAGDIVFIAGTDAQFPTGPARTKELTIHCMSMSNLATHPELPTTSPILTQLANLMRTDQLDVLIDRTLPLEEGAEAHRAVMEESLLGKIVVTP